MYIPALKPVPQHETQRDVLPGDTLIAIPAYNEERFIGSVVLQARKTGLPVLVIDDGSIDRTAEVAAAAGAVVERHDKNSGKAAALNTAFRFARACGAAALIILDGDGQHDVAEIPNLLQPIQSDEADIAIGSRFLAHSDGEVPKIRRMGQAAITIVTNVSSGAAVTDSQCGYRAFSRRAIEVLIFSSKGFSVEVEMQFQAYERQLRIKEVPINAIYADPPKRNVFRQGTQVLNGVLLLVGRHRPLLFFSVPGIISSLLGLWAGLLTIDIYQRTSTLAIGYGLLTVLCLLFGLVCIITGLLLHSVRSTFTDLERRMVDLYYSSKRNTNGN